MSSAFLGVFMPKGLAVDNQQLLSPLSAPDITAEGADDVPIAVSSSRRAPISTRSRFKVFSSALGDVSLTVTDAAVAGLAAVSQDFIIIATSWSLGTPVKTSENVVADLLLQATPGPGILLMLLSEKKESSQSTALLASKDKEINEPSPDLSI